jgi:PAT family beta-lactamase induction signal transducer AmpG
MSATAAWGCALGLAGGLLCVLAVYHWFILPTGSITKRPKGLGEIGATFGDSIVDFFRKEKIWGMLLFVFLYRSSEGLLLIEGPLFLQAAHAAGGVGLSLKEKGVIDGTVSTFVSLFAGLLGGAFMAKFGLKRKTLIFMALLLNLPHVTFIILSQLAGPGQTLSLWTVGSLVTIEKFGYSFGFVANMLYMMQQISPGKYHMTHYAFCTALMNLMLVPTQMISGPLADHFGYKAYFIIVMFCAIPSILAAMYAPFPRKFGGDAGPAEAVALVAE